MFKSFQLSAVSFQLSAVSGRLSAYSVGQPGKSGKLIAES
jgi:hypothetical protein